MRRLRWFLLTALVALIAAIAASYHFQRQFRQRHAVTPPPPLSDRLSAAAQDWSYTQMDGDRPVVTLSAKSFEQSRQEGVIDLEGVELKLYHRDGKAYDLARSARVQFDRGAGTLYSEGEVEVVMGLPESGEPKGRIVSIRTSGVRFDARSAKAETERPASFELDLGRGEATGAIYDPATRELILKNAVKLQMHPRRKGAKPMHLETGNLIYREKDSLVLMPSRCRLTRGDMRLDAENAVVRLREGAIESVEAVKAEGEERAPNRQLEYSAAELRMYFHDGGAIEKISGSNGAKLNLVSSTARTTVSCDRLDLEFTVSDGESVLRQALAMGAATAESRPVPRAGVLLADTRLLKSEVVEVMMRPGGQEMDQLSTHAPGTLEFLPNRSGQPRRQLEAERITFQYAAGNRLQSCFAAKVATRTWRTPRRKGEPEYASTWSHSLTADFDPKSQQINRLEQVGDFRYEEGARQAAAERGVLDSALNQILLEGRARVWDPTGATSADRILLDQKTGDFHAEGNVRSSRVPEKKKPGAGSQAMLLGEETLQATARKMQSSGGRKVVHYEGAVTLWQGANRLRAEAVTIDRANESLRAQGGVFSQFLDQQSDAAGKRKPPATTTVTADELVYTGKDRLAWYKGGVRLQRAELEIRARELQAWFREESGGGSSLERAFAHGEVDITHRTVGRVRHGRGEQAEYYVAEQRVVLFGGNPVLEDSARGSTRGRKLTWFAGDDRLLVDGVPAEPVRSLIRRRN